MTSRLENLGTTPHMGTFPSLLTRFPAYLLTAGILKDGFKSKGYRMYIHSPTNQQFFVLPNEVIDRLSESVGFELWGPRGEEESVVRFVTDWSTTEEDVAELISLI